MTHERGEAFYRKFLLAVQNLAGSPGVRSQPVLERDRSGWLGGKKMPTCECHTGTSVPCQPGKRPSAATVLVRARLHGHRGAHTHTHTHKPPHGRTAPAATWPPHEHAHDAVELSGSARTPLGFPAKAHGAHVSHSAELPGPSGRCWPHAPLQGAVTSFWELMGSSFPDVLGHVCSVRTCWSPSWAGGKGGSPAPGTACRVEGRLGQLGGGSRLPASVSPPVNQPNFAR